MTSIRLCRQGRRRKAVRETKQLKPRHKWTSDNVTNYFITEKQYFIHEDTVLMAYKCRPSFRFKNHSVHSVREIKEAGTALWSAWSQPHELFMGGRILISIWKICAQWQVGTMVGLAPLPLSSFRVQLRGNPVWTDQTYYQNSRNFNTLQLLLWNYDMRPDVCEYKLYRDL
jgi:hypothetical protein